MKSHLTKLLGPFKALLLVAAVALSTTESNAQISITPENNAVTLANQLVGGSGSVTISNATLTGHAEAAGTFTDGEFGITQGILLTTGMATIAAGPNDDSNAGYNNFGLGDGDLTALAGFPTFDACILEFDFVSLGTSVNFTYVFGSEEYNEYVCSSYNDVFAFFVDGPGYDNVNMALVPGTEQYVGINTINNGTIGIYGNSDICDSTHLGNSAYFVDNMTGTHLQYDGYTVPLGFSISVTPGETYHLKLAIADAADHVLDSGVFIEAYSLTSATCDPGTLVFDDYPGETELTFSPEDLPELFSVSSDGDGYNDSLVYVLTDGDELILEVNADGQFSTDTWTNGQYLLWSLSYAGGIANLEPGAYLEQLYSGHCADLSDPLIVNVVDCPELGLNIGDSCDDGNPNTENDTVNEDCVCEGTPVDSCSADAGTLQFGDGSEEMTFCADDGEPSTITLSFPENPTGDLPSVWVATDPTGFVIHYSGNLGTAESFDFDQWGFGTYLIRALSYHPTESNALNLHDNFKDGNPVNISELEGCYDWSNPITLIGETCMNDGCYAVEVLDFYQGPQTNGSPVAADRSDPNTALGEPDRSNAPGGFVSLGVGGYITLAFDGIIVDQPGNDIRIWETSYAGDDCSGPNDEHADIELSMNGIDFVYVGTVCRDGEVDMADAGFTFVSAIRITNSDNTATLDGYDVDGVEAIHGCEEPFTPGECYAGNVFEYVQGVSNTGGPIATNRTDATQALGEPERTDALVFVSLGYGGSLTLEFNGSVPNGPGDDLEIVETTYNFTSCAAYPEYADIYVSLDGSDWHFAKTVCQEDPFVDISDAGDFTHINYVRIDNNDDLSTTTDGFDVDGVVALHNCIFDVVWNPVAVEAQGLLTSYPNPTTGVSQVVFSTATTGRTIVEVYDMNGRSVATLFNEVAQADREYRLDFNGAALPNGIYVYRMTTDNETIIDKFMIAK